LLFALFFDERRFADIDHFGFCPSAIALQLAWWVLSATDSA
jgi:hypothetical protein